MEYIKIYKRYNIGFLKKLLIVSMILIAFFTSFDCSKVIIDNTVNAEPVTITIAGITLTLTQVAILIAIILLCAAMMNQDFMSALGSALQDGTDNFWEKTQYIAESFIKWSVDTYNGSAMQIYVDSMASKYDSGQALIKAYLTGDESLPKSEIFNTVRAFFSDAGINSANINAGNSSIKFYKSDTIDFTNALGEGDIMPIASFTDLPSTKYLDCGHDVTSEFLDYNTLLKLGAVDVRAEYRNLDGTYTPSVSLNNIPYLDSLGGSRMYTLFLNDITELVMVCHWNNNTGITTQWDYYNADIDQYKRVNQNFYGYTTYDWYRDFNINYVTNDGTLFELTLMLYDEISGIICWYLYVCDTTTKTIKSIYRMPLNAQATNDSCFDNSMNGISDYVTDISTYGDDITIPDLNTPFDVDLATLLQSLGLTIDANGNIVTIDGTSLLDLLNDTIVDAINDAFADAYENFGSPDEVVPDGNIPDKVKKFRLPNIIITKFPFCLPWDMMALFELLKTSAVQDTTIDLSFDWQFSNYTETFPFIIDLDWLGISKLAKVTRWITTFAWIWFLIDKTRKLGLI